MKRVLLVTAFFSLLPGHPSLGQEPQQQEEPAPQLKRMRRVKGQGPRSAPPAPAPTPGGKPEAVESDDVVRVDTELVNVLLTAVDRERRFVTTLRREDLKVYEDNVPQEVSVFERETDLPLTLAVLVDTSRSQEGVMEDEKEAARTFINSVLRPDRDQAAVISFTGEAVLEQSLTNDPGMLRAAVKRIAVEITNDDPRCENNAYEREPRCWTGVWDAVWVTADEVLSQTPERARRAVILLSDGDDTGSQTGKQEAIDLAVKNNVVVYSIGIRDEAYGEGKLDRDALRKVAERTGGRAFFPGNRAELEAAFAQIEQELRSQYLIAYSPANRKRDGSFRKLKVEVTNPELRKQKLNLLYRQGYYARSG